ncbi:MAG: GxxExxY protein [Desulfuromonadales bacterium]|nr:GxxExxY protein [Desulfuromonadales bacterium]MDW7758321.1 GxxExxY protein [Desulfuromonadales bacterium]
MAFDEVTEQVLSACFEVSNELGIGFQDSVYRSALLVALKEKGLEVQTQVPLEVWFRQQSVGEFCADLLVEGQLLVELKAMKNLAASHANQVLNCLRLTGLSIGLLVNFGAAGLDFRYLENRVDLLVAP